MKKAILHNMKDPANSPMRFEKLAQAMERASEIEATGYVVTPFNEVIDIKEGKRKSFTGGWIDCAAGYGV